MEQEIDVPVPAPIESPIMGRKLQHKRKLIRLQMRRYRRKKRLADPDRKRKLKTANVRRYRKNLKKRKAHERWLKRKADAAAKREAKAQRARQREARRVERAAVSAAQGLPELPKKPTPTQQRIDEAYARGFADGVAAGKQMALAERV